jgi:hypothetical protein
MSNFVSRSGKEERNLPTKLENVSTLSALLDGANPDIQMTRSLTRFFKKNTSIMSNKDDATSGAQGLSSKFTGPMIGSSLPSARSADVKKKLVLSLNVLIDYAKLYGFRTDSFDAESTLAHWQICSVECGWIKFLKYKLAAYMAHHLEGPLPEKPFSAEDHPNQLAGGTLGRFFRLIAESDQARSFAVGILFTKKGMPRPGDDALEQAIVTTKQVLTTVKSTPLSPFSSKAVIAEEVRRTCREVFTRRISPSDLYHPYTPSVKANYVDSRSKFGTLGTLMDESILMNRVHPSAAAKLYRDAVVMDQNDDEISDERFVHVKVRPGFREQVEVAYREVYDNVRGRASSEEANVKLVALPEALKVRVISKGPPLTYFTLKPVQKFLLRQMRELRAFKLVGETVTPEFLQEVLGKSSGAFHSLDYQSATDLLDPDISGVAVDEICDTVGMPPDIRELFHKALTGHLVEDTPQVWGQLMGSIVSFIVLCVVNLSVIRHAFEISELTRVSVVEIPAVVNGDDGLVRASRKFSGVWESVARVVGLIPSVGKVYTDDVYANINSTSYDYRLGKFVLIPYPNMGLIMGLGRSGVAKASITDTVHDYNNPFVKSLGARHHALIESCPEALRLKVHELFLRHNADTLKTTRVPWYIPEELGGVGLKPLIDYSYGSTGDLDDIVRRYAVTSTGHICGPSRLDVGIAWSFMDYRGSFGVRKVPSSQPIQARPVWQHPIRDILPRGVSMVMSESDQSFMDLSAYYMTPSLVATELGDSTRFEVIRRNERAWESKLGLMSDYSSSGGELFLDSVRDSRSTKPTGVKPIRLVGADLVTHQPLYERGD